MPDLAGAYEDAQKRMTVIAQGLTPEQIDQRVPACPAWTVHDLVAHVTSIASDLSAGRFPPDLNITLVWDPVIAQLRESWIEAALEARRALALDEVLDEWSDATATLLEMIRGTRPMPAGAPPLVEWVVVTDLGVHLHDLHGALGSTGDRDALATGLSLRSYVEGMKWRAALDHLPPLRIVAGTREWIVGEGDPVATVSADPFELSRAVAGRRHPDQLRAYDWSGDPEPFLGLFYPYGVRDEALVE